MVESASPGRQGGIALQNLLAAIVLQHLTDSVALSRQNCNMRLFRNILGILALGALIVYTVRLPDHPRAQLRTAATKAPNARRAVPVSR